MSLNSLGINSLACDLKLPKGDKTSYKTDAELNIFERREPLLEQEASSVIWLAEVTCELHPN